MRRYFWRYGEKNKVEECGESLVEGREGREGDKEGGKEEGRKGGREGGKEGGHFNKVIKYLCGLDGNQEGMSRGKQTNKQTKRTVGNVNKKKNSW